jgi:hypothetical protein
MTAPGDRGIAAQTAFGAVGCTICIGMNAAAVPRIPGPHGYWSRTFGAGSLTTSQYEPS